MAEKSLEDRIKEAELAKQEAETAKLKVEEELVRKQVNAKWYAGQSLAKFTGFVLTAVALYSVLDMAFLTDIREHKSRLIKLQAEVAKAALDSLNREKKTIAKKIDRLILIAAGFHGLDSPAVLDTALKQYRMIKEEGYFDIDLNKTGSGVANDYIVKGDSVIYDTATELTWQGGNKFHKMSWDSAEAYVDTLSFAGGNWRLPTLQQAMTLMEPERQGEYYVNPLFRDTPDLWTSDKYSDTNKWTVVFYDGNCWNDHFTKPYYVRAVRLEQ